MKRRYSHLIAPLQILIDVFIFIFIVFWINDKDYLNKSFMSFVVLFWLITSYYNSFYNIYRHYHLLKIFTLIIKQFLIFTLGYFAYFNLFKEGVIVNNQALTIISIIVSISTIKILYFLLLKQYRFHGKNFRRVIVFGESKAAKNIIKTFENKHDLGYRFCGFFSNKINISREQKGNIKEGLEFAFLNEIDEIYCENNSISSNQLREIRKFCNENNIEFKLIPETKAIYSKDFTLEHYGTVPILKPKELPFEKFENHIIKRIFDIFFSLMVCIFFLSWVLPILWIVVKLNSKGPFFFKQKRDGINGKQFYCYKIRSMISNSQADEVSTIKNDKRITKVGFFLRKTSLDELPQFFNVFLGEMSVVGPRPHMNVQTKKYLKHIDNYIIRNSVKPGITGLAQVSGYRGEVTKKSDIENRVRFDIFYIENWSFFLDIKIIFQTLISVFKGEEKAY